MSGGDVGRLLEGYVPLRSGASSDWQDVLDRARLVDGRPGREPRSLLAVALVAAVALAVPLLAVGASSGWWFFAEGHAPHPNGPVTVVRTVTWHGTNWTLSAYRSATDGVCFAMTPGAAPSLEAVGSGMNCSAVGSVRSEKDETPPPLTYLASSGRGQHWIVGAAVPSASIRVELADGRLLHAVPFTAPPELRARIDFFMALVPCDATPRAITALDARRRALGRIAIPDLGLPGNRRCT